MTQPVNPTPTSTQDFYIVDVTGRIIYHHQLSNLSNTEEINISKVSNGMYFWQLISENGIVGNGKMVVEKK